MLALVLSYKLSCGSFSSSSVNVHQNLIIQENLVWTIDETTSRSMKGAVA